MQCKALRARIQEISVILSVPLPRRVGGVDEEAGSEVPTRGPRREHLVDECFVGLHVLLAAAAADVLTYEVCDAGGLCDDATVTIDVTPVNDPPVAVDDSNSTIVFKVLEQLYGFK